MRFLYVLGAVLLLITLAQFPGMTRAASDDDDTDMDEAAPPAPPKGGPSGTDADAVEREARAIKLDGMSVEEFQSLKEKGEKHKFQAEVSRMMKLIINSLYTNKEIFLRELISNASDALDKIRFLSLTDKSVLGSTPDLQIKIHVDKENHVLHITDTGVGMTKAELIQNLGTIAKSGTSEFLAKISDGNVDTSSLIGQFGVGFYSAFLVADTVVVTSKNNDDKQYIWESNAAEFSIIEDTRADEQLGRGTRVSLYLKEEAYDFLEQETIRNLITKYSEFITFDIYLYTSKTIQVDEEEAAEEEEEETKEDGKEEDSKDDEEVEVEEAEEKPAAEKKKVDKTVWDWEVMNANKPIWTRASKDVQEEEYNKFYKSFSKDSTDPIGKIHFTAEGEVTFRSILFVPAAAPPNFFNDYGKGASNNIKLFVRRVFITDQFEDSLLPKYLSFIRGVVDSDDLPLNVSRETLQQHKLLKVIKKKLIRKALEMIKKLSDEDFKKFWKEFGTSIKLGLIEDYANRTRLSKLLRFHSSNSKEDQTSLEDYVSRMKKDQETIFFVAGASRAEVEKSPFTERLLKKGYEVLYLIEPVDEYTIQNLPEFDGKKFQNVAKEGLKLSDSEKEKEFQQTAEKDFEPLTKWMNDNLKDDIEKAVVSSRLSETPCALIASSYGWSGNMERIMKAQAYAKADDSSSNFYATQKKTLEINPRHPLIKKLNAMVKGDLDDDAKTNALELSRVMIDTARIRSGYSLGESSLFASRIERLLRQTMQVDLNEPVEAEPEPEAAEADDAEEGEEEGEEVDAKEGGDDDDEDAKKPAGEPKDEL